MTKTIEMNPTHLLFLDCETTGLDPTKHQLLSFAYAVHDLSTSLNPRRVIEKIVSVKVRHEFYVVDPNAMRVNGIDLIEHDDDAVYVQSAMTKLACDLAQYCSIPVGFSVNFDRSFLNAAMSILDPPWLGIRCFSRMSIDLSSILTFLASAQLGYPIGKCFREGAIQMMGRASRRAHSTASDVEDAIWTFQAIRNRIVRGNYELLATD